MKYNKKDHYHKKAKEEGYVARSAFKLKEIFKRYPDVFQNTGNKLDLGCSPGAWTQVLLQRLPKSTQIFGVDLEEAEDIHFPNFKFFQEDIYDWEPPEGVRFNLILSDMAPKTSGIKVTDHQRSIALCERAIEIAKEYLDFGGSLVFKVFEGNELQSLVNMLKIDYERVDRYRPDSTRAASKEIYIICIKKRR